MVRIRWRTNRKIDVLKYTLPRSAHVPRAVAHAAAIETSDARDAGTICAVAPPTKKTLKSHDKGSGANIDRTVAPVE
ncbi:MAG: hypothetical protein WDO72_05310 [Pseudomonadota bacterium]